MRSIIFLTNIENDYNEDLNLINALKKSYNVEATGWQNLIEIVKRTNFKTIIGRNFWPIYPNTKEFLKVLKRAKEMGCRFYNDVDVLTRYQVKDYLKRMKDDELPIIPTAFNIDDVQKLPESEKYIAKPIDGESSEDIITFRKSELDKVRNLDNYLFEPFLVIDYEYFFIFLDNRFLFSLRSLTNDRWNLKEYFPTSEELKQIHKFINFEKMEYGIQRVDVFKINNKFVLCELERVCPCLNLKSLDSNKKGVVTSRIIESFRRFIESG